MPELPEVETILRGLQPHLKGCYVQEVMLNIQQVDLSRILGKVKDQKSKAYPFPRGRLWIILVLTVTYFLL